MCLKANQINANYVVPRRLADSGGVLGTTGFVKSILGYTKASAYQPANGGLVELTRSPAIDHAPTTRVDAILPGPVKAHS